MRPLRVLILYWIVSLKSWWDVRSAYLKLNKVNGSINRGQTKMAKGFFKSWTEGVLPPSTKNSLGSR